GVDPRQIQQARCGIEMTMNVRRVGEFQKILAGDEVGRQLNCRTGQSRVVGVRYNKAATKKATAIQRDVIVFVEGKLAPDDDARVGRDKLELRRVVNGGDV